MSQTLQLDAPLAERYDRNMATDRRTIQKSQKTGTVTREAVRDAVSAVKSSRQSNSGQGESSAKSSGVKRK